MASTAGLALGEAPIKLIPSYKEEDLIHIDLTHSFLVGGTTEKRKAKLLKLTEDVSSPDFTELLCRLVIEFEDAAGNERLRLTTGPLLFAKFRECLGTTFRTDFDRLRVVHPQTVAGFEAVKIQFLNEYIPTTAAMDQVQYLRTTKKPYSMTVTALGMKLRQINRYGTKFNGQDGQPLFSPAHNDREIKTVLFTMMKDRWQVNFMNGGREVTEETLSFQALVRLMQTQENNHNRIFGRGGPSQVGGRQGRQGGRHNGGYRSNNRSSYGERPNNFRRIGNGDRAPNYGGRSYFGGRQAYGGGRGSFGGRGGGYNGGRGGFQGRSQFQGRGYQGRGGNGYQQGRGNFQNNGRGYYNNGGRGYNNNNNNGRQQQGNGGGQFHHDSHYHEPFEQQEQELPQEQEQQQQQQQQEQEPHEQHWIDNFGEDDGYFEQGDY